MLDFLRITSLFHVAGDEPAALDLIRDLSGEAEQDDAAEALERVLHLRAV
jgi:hypothetical protein